MHSSQKMGYNKKRKLESVVIKPNERKTMKKAKENFENNENDNHSADSLRLQRENKRYKRPAAEPMKLGKAASSKSASTSKLRRYGDDLEESSKQENENAEEVAEFNEDEDVIRMEVDPSDNFLSEEEVDTEYIEETESTEESTDGECDPSDDNEQGSSKGQDRRVVRASSSANYQKEDENQYRQSMEDKLDVLSNLLKEMQSLILEQGYGKRQEKNKRKDKDNNNKTRAKEKG